MNERTVVDREEAVEARAAEEGPPPAATNEDQQPELTFDPGSPAEWDDLRALGHRMIDDMFSDMQARRQQPVWQKMPQAVRDALSEEQVPRTAQGADVVYQDFLRNVLPYPTGNTHPRYFGWVKGTGTPLAMLADMLASGMNPHLAGFDQSAKLVEEQTLRWLAQLMGFPAAATGLLTSGGTMANLIGLNVGRFAKAGFDIRAEGLAGRPQMRLYCSSEVHSWLAKSAELMGLGRVAVCAVPVDAGFRMDLAALRAAIAADRAAGLHPLCVIGTAGTVNTGATDDLAGIAQICHDEALWFHVDGAFGALAYLAPELRPVVAGLEQADSLAFDLHKWGAMPFEVGCVLVRDGELHRAAFASAASYLTPAERGPIAGGLPFADRGIELSRGFKALKVWMSLKAHGVDKLAAMVAQNCAQAKYLADLIRREPGLELMTPVTLNVVCFRVVHPGLSDIETDALNREVLLRVQESGVAVPSGTTLLGRYCLRVANVNARARREDFAILVDAVRSHAAQAIAGGFTRR